MIDSMLIIAASLWCGVPNLPMSSEKKDEKIDKCRMEFIECVELHKSVERWDTNAIPPVCLAKKK
jgi:hypothetical protein